MVCLCPSGVRKSLKYVFSPFNKEDLELVSLKPLHKHLIKLVNMLLLITSFN